MLLCMVKCSPEELFGSGDVPRNARIDNLLKTAGSVCANFSEK